MIRAGELRERITLKGTTRTVDARWGVANTATVTDTVWAKVKELRAGEQMDGQQVQSDVTHTVTIRYRADIADRFSITWRGRSLEIVGIVDPDGHRRELEITCREQPEAANV